MAGGRYLALAFALALAACAGNGGASGRGRQVYQAQCIQCHNSNPAKNGPLGPAVKGSSRQLLEARVLRGTYPPGYKPKRESGVMRPMPHLASALPDLAAFLK